MAKKIVLGLTLLIIMTVIGFFGFVFLYGKKITEAAVVAVGKNIALPALNVALLSQLFSSGFDSQDEAIKYMEKIRSRGYSKNEVGMLISFLGLKKELTAYKQHTGHLPTTIFDLKLPKERITDKNGNYFHYAAQGDYVLLGSPGQDTAWNMTDSLKQKILLNKYEFVFKEDDDFIVKIVLD